MQEEVIALFRQFENMPVKELVDDPHGRVVAYSNFVFSRRTLKHLAEKGDEGFSMLELIPDTIEFPDTILRSSDCRRLYSRHLKHRPEIHIVIIENDRLIITSFMTDKKYLKRFEILWRTGTSLS